MLKIKTTLILRGSHKRMSEGYKLARKKMNPMSKGNNNYEQKKSI